MQSRNPQIVTQSTHTWKGRVSKANKWLYSIKKKMKLLLTQECQKPSRNRHNSNSHQYSEHRQQKHIQPFLAQLHTLYGKKPHRNPFLYHQLRTNRQAIGWGPCCHQTGGRYNMNTWEGMVKLHASAKKTHKFSYSTSWMIVTKQNWGQVAVTFIHVRAMMYVNGEGPYSES